MCRGGARYGGWRFHGYDVPLFHTMCFSLQEKSIWNLCAVLIGSVPLWRLWPLNDPLMIATMTFFAHLCTYVTSKNFDLVYDIWHWPWIVQAQILKYLYLMNCWSDSHEIKMKQIIWILGWPCGLGHLTIHMTLTLSIQGQCFRPYRRDGKADSRGKKGVWFSHSWLWPWLGDHGGVNVCTQFDRGDFRRWRAVNTSSVFIGNDYNV